MSENQYEKLIKGHLEHWARWFASSFSDGSSSIFGLIQDTCGEVSRGSGKSLLPVDEVAEEVEMHVNFLNSWTPKHAKVLRVQYIRDWGGTGTKFERMGVSKSKYYELLSAAHMALISSLYGHRAAQIFKDVEYQEEQAAKARKPKFRNPKTGKHITAWRPH